MVKPPERGADHPPHSLQGQRKSTVIHIPPVGLNGLFYELLLCKVVMKIQVCVVHDLQLFLYILF